MKKYAGNSALNTLASIVRTALTDKQDKITGSQGQVAGFNASGQVAAIDMPVSSFNGRTGAILPQSGDYTASMVGADAAGSANAVQKNLDNKITFGTEDLIAGQSNLADGTVYFVYEVDT